MIRVLALYLGLLAPALASNLTLWDSLVGECQVATFRCVQDSLHRSLERCLSADFNVTESILFRKNRNKYSLEANTPHDVEEEGFGDWVNRVESAEAELDGTERTIKEMDEEERTKLKSVGGVSDVLYNKGLYYLMTHDLELHLPDFLFGGGTLRISPRSIEEDGGALVKVHFQEPPTTGRIFLKKIKQIFKKKLMTSFMAAMLIIKLIKVKLMFLLPIIVGVGTAKKILLKVLLFLFPALAHLFKLCAFYHHHHTKYHLHHHHQVAHHHHHTPPAYVPTWEYSHPPPGADIIHRSEADGNELSSWGIEYIEPEKPISRLYSLPQHAPNVVGGVASGPLPPGGPIGPAPHISSRVEDPFYSPILHRLDRVFGELGFTEEPCKERLLCSMYKAPERFSPHSNLVSAEISRDPSELQKPVFNNPSVIRFYRYVEAARLGQDGKDCLTLFPSCSLLTE